MSDYTPFDAQEWLEAGPQIVKRGGPGSGHFGHEGRPGQRGGSAPGEGTTASDGKETTVSEARASGANRLRQLAQARDKSQTRELSSVTLEEEYWGLRDRMGDWLEKHGIPFEWDDPFDIATKYQKNYKPDELETTVSELKAGGHPRGEGETSVGITSQHEGVLPGWQVQAEMEDFRSRLNAIEGVSDVRAYVGRGAWKGGSEETWVVRFNGNGEAKRLIAETGARYGQDAVLIMEPPTPENTHPITELSFDRNLTGAERDGINQRMADLGFGGWTWGVARTERMPLLRVASVPDFGSDDAQHPGLMQALGTELSALGLNPRRDDFQVAVTTAGPGGRVAYDEFINSLTLYKERHHGVNAGVGRAHSPAVGAGERAGQDRPGDLAGRTAGTSGASDEGGRGAGHSHSEGVVTPILRRFVFRGGPGSGHHGHEGRPGVRGGSLPGDGTTISEGKRGGEYAKVYADRKQSFLARYNKLIADRDTYEAHQSPSDGPTTTLEADLAANAAKGPPWNGSVKLMSGDLRRFADQTISWMNRLRDTGGYKTEKRALEILKMDLEAYANQPDKLMERVSIFLALDLPYIMHGEPGFNVPAMVAPDGTVNAEHPVLQAMAQAGGVKGEAIINILQVAQSRADAMRLIDTAAMELRAGTDSMADYYAKAPAVREDVSPIRSEVMAQAADAEQRVRDIEARLPELEAAYFGMVHVINAPDADKTMSQEDWFRTAEGADDTLEAYRQAQRELSDAKMEAKDLAHRVLDEALMVKGERAPLRIDSDNDDALSWKPTAREGQLTQAERAVRWLASMADPSTIDPAFAAVRLINTESEEGRGGWSQSRNAFSARSGWDTTTYIHELGHYFEGRNPGVHAAAVAFLRDRTTGQVDRHLETLQVGMGYDFDETSRPDAFMHAYVGKVYEDYYATEVVSMGLEWLYKDPVGFANADPEHFDLTVGMLKGLWNKSS